MFSLFVLSVLAAAVSALPYGGRIYGGKAVEIKDYPYQVSLEVFSSHFCGGSIVSKNHIITAAHCTEEYTADILSVRAGSSLINQGGSVHRVVRVIPHERYHDNSYGTPVNDIAIIEVAEPFEFDDTRQPIALYNEVARPSSLADISGWGLTESGFPEVLMATKVPIYDKVKCDNVYYILFGGIPDGQICAGDYDLGGKDTCEGDSGGPLAIDGRLAGIVSYGLGCAMPRWPGVYTEVAYYRQWIEKHVQL